MPRPDRPFRVPGGTGGAWLVAALATGWSALATLCLLWPGVGTADPDAALPAGFEGDRWGFELIVIAPVAAVIVAAGAYVVVTRAVDRAPARRSEAHA